MIYDLPTALTVQGQPYAIRTDYRVMLDLFEAFNDPDLSDEDKAIVCLGILFIAPETLPADGLEEALQQASWFLNCGSDAQAQQKAPKLVDWEKDFPYIVAPINRVAGREVRAIPYNRETNEGGLHWWTFISYYYEIGGDCVFAQIVRIRDQLARGKKLDKMDREWYRKNKALVDMPQKLTSLDQETIKLWTGGK